MSDVQINTVRSNEYNGRKVVLRDTHSVQMSIPRFFQLALVSDTGIVPARCPVFGTVYFTQQNHAVAGNWVVVQENTGGQFDRWHIFMHLDSIAVSEGDSISQGTSVGMIGNTGSSTGPHLHYQIATANPLETYRTSEDPMVTFDRGSLNPSWTMEGAVAAHNWDYIQLDDQATDYGPPGGGGGGGNIKSLNIQLRINPPPEIQFSLRYPLISNTDSLDNMRRVTPGYFKPSELYEAHNSHIYPETYQMKDTTRTDILMSWQYSIQLSEKPVLVFTTDGRDPLQHGRTVFLKQEGDFWINDYEASANVFPILGGYALPLNLRAALIDADDHSLILTRASAVFTRESMLTITEQNSRLRRYFQALLADAPAKGKNMYSEDYHGYISINEDYESSKYYDLIPGLEDGEN